jgi:hypothetical protein
MAFHDPQNANQDGNFLSSGSLGPHPLLWTDSEITGKFVSPFPSFPKEKRFKWASIYWPEDNDQLFSQKRKGKSVA